MRYMLIWPCPSLAVRLEPTFRQYSVRPVLLSYSPETDQTAVRHDRSVCTGHFAKAHHDVQMSAGIELSPAKRWYRVAMPLFAASLHASGPRIFFGQFPL